MSGSSAESILKMINARSMSDPVVKVAMAVDCDDVRTDMLAIQKQPRNLIGKCIRVILDNSPIHVEYESMFIHVFFLLTLSAISIYASLMVHKIALHHATVLRLDVPGYSKS